MMKCLILFSTLAFVASAFDAVETNDWNSVLNAEKDNRKIHEDVDPIETLQAKSGMIDSDPDYESNDGFKNQNQESSNVMKYFAYGAMLIIVIKFALLPGEEDDVPVNRRNVTHRSLFQRFLDLVWGQREVHRQQRHGGHRNRTGQQRQEGRRYYEVPRNQDGRRYYEGPRIQDGRRYYENPRNHQYQRVREVPVTTWIIVFALVCYTWSWSGKNEGNHEYGKYDEWRETICENQNKAIYEDIDACIQTEPNHVRDCMDETVPAANEKISFFETACRNISVFTMYDDCIGKYQKNEDNEKQMEFESATVECYETIMEKYSLLTSKSVSKTESPDKLENRG